MTTSDAIEQLSAARPELARQTRFVMDDEMRAALRTSIIESTEVSKNTYRSSAMGRHRTVATSVGVAVCAAIAAIVLVVVPDHPQNAAAAVVAKALTALQSQDVGVLVSHQIDYGSHNSPPSVSITWQDPRRSYHFRTDIPGPPKSEVGGYVESGHPKIISLNFSNRSAVITPVANVSSYVPYAPTKAQLQAAQRAGNLAVVGRQSVAGHNTIHLRGFSRMGQMDLWIDSMDYHLVRTELRLTNGQHLIINVQWLPPTPANLSLLNVTVPRGFTVVTT
jgi:hypothetical protein